MRLKRKPQQEGGAEGSHESATRWCCRHDDLESQVLLPRVAAVAQHWIPNIDLTNCFPDLKPFFRWDPVGLRRLARHSTIYEWSDFLLIMTTKNEPRCLHRVEVHHAIIFFTGRCFQGSESTDLENFIRHFKRASSRRSNSLCRQTSLSERRRIQTCHPLWDRDPNPNSFKGYEGHIGKLRPNPEPQPPLTHVPLSNPRPAVSDRPQVLHPK